LVKGIRGNILYLRYQVWNFFLHISTYPSALVTASQVIGQSKGGNDLNKNK